MVESYVSLCGKPRRDAHVLVQPQDCLVDFLYAGEYVGLVDIARIDTGSGRGICYLIDDVLDFRDIVVFRRVDHFRFGIFDFGFVRHGDSGSYTYVMMSMRTQEVWAG
jgi:hypothetical protein